MKYIIGFIEVILDNPKEGCRICILFIVTIFAIFCGGIYYGILEGGKKVLDKLKKM